MFLFKRKCKHEYEELGKFYKEYLTEYSNCFDAIVVYRKEKCRKCGDIHDVRISSENFLPEMYYTEMGYTINKKGRYINYLISKGIKLEVDL